jgi:hypothetical protein
VDVSVEQVSAFENASVVQSTSKMDINTEDFIPSITDTNGINDVVQESEISMPDKRDSMFHFRHDISRSSSSLKTRSHTGSCSRSSTPPFRSAVDGKTSNVEHGKSRCLHVEMPPPTARIMNEAVTWTWTNAIIM